MEVANASLLDEPTAAAEAMTMLRRVQGGGEGGLPRVGPGASRRPSTSCTCRAEPLGIELVVAEPDRMVFDERVFGVLLQTPDERGALHDLRGVIARAHAAGVLVAVATDLLALALATPPGEMGADVVIGSAQRFGVPMGYGGPHAAFFATREQYVRQAPGRIIGVSVDAQGNRAYRMALQTREQHIRREKATSNICTAQALLANMAAMYGVYHGPDGLRAIAARVHGLARELARRLAALGCDAAERRLLRHARARRAGGRAGGASGTPRSRRATTSASTRRARTKSASRSTRSRHAADLDAVAGGLRARAEGGRARGRPDLRRGARVAGAPWPGRRPS